MIVQHCRVKTLCVTNIRVWNRAHISDKLLKGRSDLERSIW